MLMLTPTAIEVVRTITSAEGTPEDAGLRISTADGAETLQLEVAAVPAEQDQILTAEGSRIFLDEDAAAFLDDKVLDTGQDANGQGGFVIAQQAQYT
ncbi:hypothetical protein NONI108955_05215 [Nocardia ninae]|uniref:Iron-sulfur cluster biosynthesis protein n=2 Tax=Nocardia TaxID=1817 RepID=A0A511MBW3_9NOCA|nr:MULTISPECIES: hypothetical protein [Nocardia]QBS40356.1 hypothetical protein DMB37_09750 [Nocardia sp. CS682]GEM37578.1 iron-sulfur cluster biosynthesis protein [Nocardia ninae NBRC 108245]